MLQTKNLRIAEFTPLITPQQLEQQLSPTDEIRETVRKSRAAISEMIHGEDKRRLAIVVGPCSIHEPESAFEYATRLSKVADATHEHLLLVMRAYFEKPRTIVGWKGLLSDPRLDGSSRGSPLQENAPRRTFARTGPSLPGDRASPIRRPRARSTGRPRPTAPRALRGRPHRAADR